MLRRALFPLLHAARLTWWRWARANLTARDPCHPDLPAIVLRISELEAS